MCLVQIFRNCRIHLEVCTSPNSNSLCITVEIPTVLSAGRSLTAQFRIGRITCWSRRTVNYPVFGTHTYVLRSHNTDDRFVLACATDLLMDKSFTECFVECAQDYSQSVSECCATSNDELNVL